MSPDQAAALVDRIAATWRGRLSASERAIWADALADLDHHAAERAVDQLACTEARRPPIAAIRHAANAGRHPSGQPGPEWQVLSEWRDQSGAAWTSQTWHVDEATARQAFIAAQRTGDHPKTVDLLRHSEHGPVTLAERANIPARVSIS